MRTRDRPVDPARAMAERGDLIALVGTSTRVLDDCRLPNGALVDAPSHLPSYPVDGPDGLACIPGLTLPLAILAGDALGRDERSAVLPWLLRRADRLRETGTLASRYAVHGAVTVPQPDRTGTATLLWAALRRSRRLDAESAEVVRLLALSVTDSIGGPLAREIEGIAMVGLVATLPDDVRPIADSAAGGSVDHHADGVGPMDDLSTWALLALAMSGEDRPGATGDTVATGAADVLARRAAGTLARGSDGRTGGVPDLFIAVVALVAQGRDADADDLFSAALSTADHHGHFPDLMPSGGGGVARPWLASHLAFVWAAGALGRLADLPRSGYTSAKRRSSVG